MDEMNMRRHCIADPNDSDPAFRQWLASKPGAKQCWSEARQFDAELASGLQAIELPEGLNGRIMLRAGLSAQQRRRRHVLAGLALAASVLMAVNWSLKPQTAATPGAFQQLALDHVHKEIGHLQHPPGHVSAALVSNLFEQMGGRLNGSLGDIQFAFNCPTPKGRSLHLIADNSAGRVTLLYLATASADTQAVAFSDQQFSGRTVLPAAGGALAIISDKPQAIDEMQQALDKALTWQDARLAEATPPLLAVAQSDTRL